MTNSSSIVVESSLDAWELESSVLESSGGVVKNFDILVVSIHCSLILPNEDKSKVPLNGSLNAENEN